MGPKCGNAARGTLLSPLRCSGGSAGVKSGNADPGILLRTSGESSMIGMDREVSEMSRFSSSLLSATEFRLFAGCRGEG